MYQSRHGWRAILLSINMLMSHNNKSTVYTAFQVDLAYTKGFRLDIIYYYQFYQYSSLTAVIEGLILAIGC